MKDFRLSLRLMPRFRDVMPCSFVDEYQRFGGNWSIHFQVRMVILYSDYNCLGHNTACSIIR
jgi:hypothetical protein